jgi:hypothetical protein
VFGGAHLGHDSGCPNDNDWTPQLKLAEHVPATIVRNRETVEPFPNPKPFRCKGWAAVISMKPRNGKGKSLKSKDSGKRAEQNGPSIVKFSLCLLPFEFNS